MYESPFALIANETVWPAEQPSRSLIVTIEPGASFTVPKWSSGGGAFANVVSLVAISWR